MSETKTTQSIWGECFTDNDIAERRAGLAPHLEVARALAPVALKPNVHFVELPAQRPNLPPLPQQEAAEIHLIAS